MRHLARRILAHAPPVGDERQARPGTLQVIDDLRPQLVNLMGIGGFRGLLARAIVLGGEEARWLRAVHVKADGSLSGLVEHATLAPGQFAEGKVVLLAQLLGALVALIGLSLTLRIVLDIWPKLSLDDLNLGNGGNRETQE